MLQQVLAVAAGGALGAVARYLVYAMTAHYLGPHFPYGTLIVNIVGSFAMGILTEGMALAWTISLQARLFLVVGILGAFTTFSTFSLDVALLYARGKLFLCALYITTSVVLSVGAMFLGLFVMRRLLGPSGP